MKKNTKKKKRSLFSKVLLIVLGVLALVGLVVDIWLWGVLSRYEKREAKKEAERQNAGSPSITQMAKDPEVTNTPTPTEAPKLQAMKFKVMDGVTVYVDGVALDTSKLTVEKSKENEYDSLYTFINDYSEYKNLPDRVTMPSISIFSTEIYENSVVTAKNEAGEEVEILKYQDVDGSLFYSTGFNNDKSQYEEVTKFAWDFAVAYSYFVAGDRGAGTISGYFPSGSRYYSIVSSVDTAWYTKHANLPTYSEREVKEFKGYSDNLFYVDIYMLETIYAMYYDNERVDRDVSLGLWIAKLDGSYKICGIIFK